MSGAFLYASQECPGADFETEGGPVELFKTSRFIGKVNDLLANAAKKFDAYPGEEKTVNIIPLKLPNTDEKAFGAAYSFTRDGMLDEVVVLGQDDTRLN